MAWEVRAYLDDGGSPTVCKVDTIEEVQGRIESILRDGFDIEKEDHYVRYPVRVIKRVEAFKRE